VERREKNIEGARPLSQKRKIENENKKERSAFMEARACVRWWALYVGTGRMDFSVAPCEIREAAAAEAEAEAEAAAVAAEAEAEAVETAATSGDLLTLGRVDANPPRSAGQKRQDK
jgi:regulator of protease activity HflC (stomatin/prohibitin superfamily)